MIAEGNFDTADDWVNPLKPRSDAEARELRELVTRLRERWGDHDGDNLVEFCQVTACWSEQTYIGIVRKAHELSTENPEWWTGAVKATLDDWAEEAPTPKE